MCGIFAILNYKNNDVSDFLSNNGRGPENTTTGIYDTTFMGFHRLAINGINEGSNQPIYSKGIVLVCNGEIYNFRQLYKKLNIDPLTDSDCEVIIHMYEKYGIDETLKQLDGVFGFILYDRINNIKIVARDPFGVRPLYVGDQHVYGSEMKYMKTCDNIKQFPPGSYTIYQSDDTQFTCRYHQLNAKTLICNEGRCIKTN